jgi:hypothetical protein
MWVNPLDVNDQADVELEPSGDLDAATVAALERVTGGSL